MTLKPNGKIMTIAEQIIEDPVTGLTLQFRAAPDGSLRLHLWGDISPCGNRDFCFDVDGAMDGAGTGTCQPPKPTWLKMDAEGQG